MKATHIKAPHIFVIAILALLLPGTAFTPNTAFADVTSGYVNYSKKAKFETVRDDLKDAIINRGYVVDFVGHFNAMMTRTAEAVGSVTASGKSPYSNAQYMQFCAAQLTHEAIQADTQNIANCPYIVFVYEIAYEPGIVHVGYRRPAPGSNKASRMVNKKIDALLDGIVKEAIK